LPLPEETRTKGQWAERPAASHLLVDEVPAVPDCRLDGSYRGERRLM